MTISRSNTTAGITLINPLAVAHCCQRHGVASAKSDPVDAWRPALGQS